MALPSTQYPKFRSRPSTQPLGHVADILCYVFIFFWLKSSLNCLLNIMVLSVFSPEKLYKSIYYTCFCVHYFKSYGEIDNILDTWRTSWI